MKLKSKVPLFQRESAKENRLYGIRSISIAFNDLQKDTCLVCPRRCSSSEVQPEISFENVLPISQLQFLHLHSCEKLRNRSFWIRRVSLENRKDC